MLRPLNMIYFETRNLYLKFCKFKMEINIAGREIGIIHTFNMLLFVLSYRHGSIATPNILSTYNGS